MVIKIFKFIKNKNKHSIFLALLFVFMYTIRIHKFEERPIDNQKK